MNKRAIILLVFFLSGAVRAGTVTVVVPEQIKVDIPRINSYFEDLKNKPGIDKLVIKIYYFSSGVEVLTLKNGKIIQSEKPGLVKALVKIHSNNKLKKTLFVSAKGKDKPELLRNLAQKIALALRK